MSKDYLSQETDSGSCQDACTARETKRPAAGFTCSWAFTFLAQPADYDDLTTLGLDLGFSNHRHFSAAFREVYGRSPSEFRQSALHK